MLDLKELLIGAVLLWAYRVSLGQLAGRVSHTHAWTGPQEKVTARDCDQFLGVSSLTVPFFRFLRLVGLHFGHFPVDQEIRMVGI
jgi:hypothetical protein